MDKYTGPSPYRPLSTTQLEVRLVCLQLDSLEEPIVCGLEYAPLDAAHPAYVAISYVWGDPIPTKTISLCGINYPVTESLCLTLRRVRQRLRTEKSGVNTHALIWIDALSINQSDLAEREVQVLRMAEIYSGASKLLAYIGEPGEDAKNYLHELRCTSVAFRSLLNSLYGNIDILEVDDSQIEPLLQSFTKPGSRTDSVLRILHAICERKFFRRVWIFQEIVLRFNSAILMLGDQGMLLRDLVVLLRIFCRTLVHPANIKYVSLGEHLNSITLAHKSTSRSGEYVGHAPTRLIMLLHAVCGHEATDIRDRIYGLLSLLGDGLPTNLRPAYEGDHEMVYYNYTRWLLESTKDLTILDAGSFNSFHVPTWTSKLRIDSRRISRWGGNRVNNAFHAPNRVQADVSFSEDGRRLFVTGFCLGQVIRVIDNEHAKATEGTSWPQRAELTQWLQRFEEDVIQTGLNIRPEETRDDGMERVSKTLFPVTPEVFTKFYKTYLGKRSTLKWRSLDDRLPVEDARMFNVLRSVGHLVLENGEYCSAPLPRFTDQAMALDPPRLGDSVYMFKGSEKATVIREEYGRVYQIATCEGASSRWLSSVDEEEWSTYPLDQISLS